RARENSHALAETAGVQAVDRAHAGRYRFANVRALQRANAPAVDAPRLAKRQRPFVVDRRAEAVKHSAEQLITATDARRRGDVFDPVAARNPADVRERHQQGTVVLKSDDFGNALPLALTADPTRRSDRQRKIRRFDRQPADRLNL